ncbi:MAG: dTDP-4-dehydrorhamnose reductase [Spirochaetales bacterium]|jgi:dTDP-4-dehydrorhamnose reductase|nr:dTDP-4-dehydrorhamnose reductase [Spirochaetales bacterium]|tara:strand:- start:524 stop:1396 length:873 start_codon:yes stop_codon:yes gene_type:complete
MKVAVTGANGQLGIDICDAFRNNGDQVTEINHCDFDIVDFSKVQRTLQSLMPAMVINTAAMHNVEACEENPAAAFAVNGIGARNLALASQDIAATLLHVSTDYIFDGTKQEPYIETDLPQPLNVYGNTKLAGEYFIKSSMKKYYIFRVSGLYGHNLCRAKGGLNFVSLMLKLADERDEVRVVDTEFVSPTFTEDVAKQIVHMSNNTNYGTYHATAQGGCSWHNFAKKIFALTGKKILLSRAMPGEFPAKVPRPSYSILENYGLQAANLDIMPHWEDGLKKYLSLEPLAKL